MRRETILGQRLRQEREAQGYTQKSLAHEAGVQPTTISRLENGHTLPMSASLGVVQDLASALNVTVDYLVGHSVPPDIGKRPMNHITRELSEVYLELNATSQFAILGYAKYLRSIEEHEEQQRKEQQRGQ